MFSGRPGFRVRVPNEEVPGLHLWKPKEAPGLHLWKPEEEVQGWRAESSASPEASLGQGPFGNLAFRFGSGLSGTTEDIEPVAAGDLTCQACKGGPPSGMTGAYREGKDVLCAKCIVKRLGYENVPSSELPGLLVPWTLNRK